MGDPEDATLEGTRDGRRRMASPVVTKALAVGNKRYRPLLLVLNAPHVWLAGDPELKYVDRRGETQRQRVPKTVIELTEAERSEVDPLAGRPVREALLAYAERIWGARAEVLG